MIRIAKRGIGIAVEFDQSLAPFDLPGQVDYPYPGTVPYWVQFDSGCGVVYLFEAGREVGLEPDLDNKSIIKNKTKFRRMF